MNTLDEPSLAQLAISALERTAFLIADAADVKLDAIDFEPTYFSIITYKGASAGSIYLEADEGFMRECIASLLGIEEDKVNCSSMGADALDELANIIAGMVVIELGGDDHRFELGIPTHCSQETATHLAEDRTCLCLLMSENGRLRIRWTTGTVGAIAA